jgi:predicted amidohydrolase
VWIATVGKAARQLISNAEASLGHRQQHDAAVRCETTAIEGGCYLLARNGWKREREEIIVGHGECGGAMA